MSRVKLRPVHVGEPMEAWILAAFIVAVNHGWEAPYRPRDPIASLGLHTCLVEDLNDAMRWLVTRNPESFEWDE